MLYLSLRARVYNLASPTRVYAEEVSLYQPEIRRQPVGVVIVGENHKKQTGFILLRARWDSNPTPSGDISHLIPLF